MIAVRAGTILIDERLCDPSKLGRLRFTCAHELAHWVLHKKLYSGTGDVAAYNGNVSSDESHGIIERQADALASALLMPLPQIKKCFYRLRIGRTDEQLIAEMAAYFRGFQASNADSSKIHQPAHNQRAGIESCFPLSLSPPLCYFVPNMFAILRTRRNIL